VRGGATAQESSGLRRLGRAPEIRGTQRWFNTPGGRPLTLARLRSQHRVVLVDFWTYTCINCIRTLPQLKAWDAKYRGDGLTIIGVHTPEFPFEKDAGNVVAAIRQDGVRYAVAQDNDNVTWDAYANEYWPAEYLIDAQGQVRHVHFGEGDYGKTEAAIRALLAESGRTRLGGMAHARVQTPSGLATPETYLGSARAQGFDKPITDGMQRYYGGRPALPLNGFAYRGVWKIGPESATAKQGARLYARFQARRVYLVLGSPGRSRHVRVMLDGEPMRTLTVRRQRLYTLVDLPRVGRHDLELQLDPGVNGYAFTFG
jgi:thiol-disulfide isomerase/thioredoxin